MQQCFPKVYCIITKTFKLGVSRIFTICKPCMFSQIQLHMATYVASQSDYDPAWQLAVAMQLASQLPSYCMAQNCNKSQQFVKILALKFSPFVHKDDQIHQFYFSNPNSSIFSPITIAIQQQQYSQLARKQLQRYNTSTLVHFCASQVSCF